MSDYDPLKVEANRRRTVGYGSKALERAADCARGLRFGRHDVGRPRAVLLFLRHLAKLPALVWYLVRLPRLRVWLSDQATGRMLGEHLSLRRWGLPRFRLAQGVMLLPPDFATSSGAAPPRGYAQTSTVRANAGSAVHRETVPDWLPPEPVGHWSTRGLTCSAPTERFWATSRAGEIVGEAWLTVDGEFALLHALVCSESNVRWLLHSAIVERLCSSGCRLLMTNSYDVPLMSPGVQYFQRLLGYTVAHLRPPARRPTTRPQPSTRPAWAQAGAPRWPRPPSRASCSRGRCPIRCTSPESTR